MMPLNTKFVNFVSLTITTWIIKTLVLVSFFASLTGCADKNSKTPEEPYGTMGRSALTGDLSQQLNDVFEKHYSAAEGRTYEQLIDTYTPQFLPSINVDVKRADYYDDFVNAFELSEAATKILDELGFVVIPSPARNRAPYSEFSSNGAGPADIFYRVFANDLPVFVSADSVLHAWHRTFDKIMETTEERKMVDVLKQMLDKTMGALDRSNQAGKDALFYLAVSRALLDSEWDIPSDVEADVNTYLSLAMDNYYAVFVGQTNAINPSGLLTICAQTDLDNCRGDYASIAERYAQQPAPSYSSRVFACDVPPLAMRFFPQRFGYGSWVTSRTTTPRLKPAVDGGRAMAMTEDVLFALGADRAVQ